MPPPERYQAHLFCITVHYTSEPGAEVINAEDVLCDTFAPGDYGQGQLEKCPSTGRTHLQAFCWVKDKTTITGMKKKYSSKHWYPYKDQVHWIVADGTVEDNETYTSKSQTAIPGTLRTWGTRPSVGQGARSDIMSAWNAFRVGGVQRVLAEHPAMWLRYSTGFIRAAALLAVPTPMPSPTTWREWQDGLLKELEGKPDDRKIIWYYDQSGAAGKSTIVRYVCTNSKGIMLEGKVADMAYAYNGERVVFFDVARTQADNMDHLYSFAEKLKNGMVSSPKYESRTKFFDPPHVVFMANSLPDYSKWSSDRYDVRTLNPIDF